MTRLAIWGIWHQLSVVYKFFYVLLLGLSLYAVTSIGIILKTGVLLESNQALHKLRIRSRRTRDLIISAVFLFGVVFFQALTEPTYTLDFALTLQNRIILQTFQVHFAYAANVFFLFVVVYLLQAFASRRIDRVELINNGDNK
ncbi:MAG: hypothetical protein ACJ71N_07710 [Terriglobales bacterium]|jgi:hypothetical protein